MSQPETKKQMLATSINPESVSMNSLSVVVLGESEKRRRTLSTALTGTQAQIAREAALPELDALPGFLENRCDVLIVDLDQDPERALNLLEAACAFSGKITAMVYSRVADHDLLVRSMRAGAREFLCDPLSPDAITEALVRASVRREELNPQKKTSGKILVFTGAKGGAGATTVAANFAVALAKESGQSVVLVDLDLRLGDAALTLGLSPEFCTADALQNEPRLDSEFLSKLLVRHRSGLQVLAAPDEYNTFSPSNSAVLKLISILRGDFAWVVVDAGARSGGYLQLLFNEAEKIYLVAQVSVVELRNSNRIIGSQFKREAAHKLEVVLNRYAARAGEIDEQSIVRALTVSPKWRIPSDYHAVQRAQNAAHALTEKDGSIARVFVQMAQAAYGKTGEEGRKKKFGLF